MPHFLVQISERTTSWEGPIEAPNPEEAAEQATWTLAQTVQRVVQIASDENGSPAIYDREDLQLDQ